MSHFTHHFRTESGSLSIHVSFLLLDLFREGRRAEGRGVMWCNLMLSFTRYPTTDQNMESLTAGKKKKPRFDSSGECSNNRLQKYSIIFLLSL